MLGLEGDEVVDGARLLDKPPATERNSLSAPQNWKFNPSGAASMHSSISASPLRNRRLTHSRSMTRHSSRLPWDSFAELRRLMVACNHFVGGAGSRRCQRRQSRAVPPAAASCAAAASQGELGSPCVAGELRAGDVRRQWQHFDDGFKRRDEPGLRAHAGPVEQLPRRGQGPAAGRVRRVVQDIEDQAETFLVSLGLVEPALLPTESL